MLCLPDILSEALDAFYMEHRRCGEVDTGVEDGRVWMTCDGCGASLFRVIEIALV